MKFIYTCTCITNFERENTFKRFAIYFYCFSDNCCRAIAVGNGSDPHMNRHDPAFLQRITRCLSAFLLQIKSAS